MNAISTSQFVLLLSVVSFAGSARIFGVFLVPSYSHQIVFQPIYRELSLRGHEVVVVTPNPLKDPSLTNLTEIDSSYLYKYSSFIKDEMDFSNYKELITKTNIWTEFLSKEILKDKRVIRIYNNTKESFDLVLTEYVTPILHMFGLKFNCPVIGMVSLDAYMGAHTIMGNPIHPLLTGDMFLSFDNMDSILKKIQYSYYFLWNKWHYNYEIHPRCDKIVRKYMGDGLPTLAEGEKNTSMMFVTTNYFMSPVKPLAPAVIPLSFMHVKPVKPLPVDLQKIMDDSVQGVVYVSLGSNVKSSSLPEHVKKVIVEALSELPYTVLWKWETDNVPGVGKNVVTRKWFPQQDVLGHPSVRVFVTQGGLQSIEEAISRGVPMVGMPFIGDQLLNVNKLIELGIARHVDPKEMSKKDLMEAVTEVAENLKYSKKIKNIRDIAYDQPMTSLERAVWWSEYVIRHKGARHLRSVIADVPLWKYLLLDVVAVVLGVIIFFVLIACRIVGFLKRKFKVTEKIKTT